MVSLLEEVGGHWIYTSPTEGVPPPARPGPITLHPLVFDARLSAQHYAGISIQTFLWLHHYVFDTTYEPTFDYRVVEQWAGYEEVNRRFAREISLAHQNSSDEIVLVHDFHLMMVPLFFTDDTPGRQSRLIYFHHVPWCEPDYFSLLPEWLRTRVLESLLRCDVVGFHSRRWANAFLACCERFLPAVKVDGNRVEYAGHRSTVAVAPGPIDGGALLELREDPSTAAWRERLLARARHRRPVVRVDRLDLWKNVIRGFEAFELMLSRDPALADELWFCAVVTPPRRPSERSGRYRDRCEETVARINDRFNPGSGAATEPVSLIYPQAGDNTRHRAVAALEVSAVTLVNPTFDGLNMVAKEALVVGSAPVLLSVNAGAYEQLRDGVTPIHPFDVEATADALSTAVAGDAVDDAGGRRAALRQESAAEWLRRLLGETDG
ncbi:trehalose-6-phosphate synthase [Micromonospora sp. NPDC049282]|uniref:trehalose-6-phosphate synthase n=1 Tax=Micromonospora sp. NPDC049282 TaxID=3364269 RepID=UPI0037220B59